MPAQRLIDLAPAAAETEGSVSFEGRDVDEATFLEVLDEAVAALEASGISYRRDGWAGIGDLRASTLDARR